MHCIFKKLINGLGKILLNIFLAIAMIILMAIIAHILFGMLYVVAQVFLDVKVLNVYYIYFGIFGWVSLFGFLFYSIMRWLIDVYDECKCHKSK
jgi:hypothetical protein